jgi:hypothetical protein
MSSDKDSILEGLKTEWALFWDTLFAEDENETSESKSESTTKDPFETGKIEVLSLDKIKEITKALSKDRRTLNQKIESLNKQLEEKSSQLENVRLVGGTEEEIIQEMNMLSDQGSILSQKLSKINERLKVARKREDEIKKSVNL